MWPWGGNSFGSRTRNKRSRLGIGRENCARPDRLGTPESLFFPKSEALLSTRATTSIVFMPPDTLKATPQLLAALPSRLRGASIDVGSEPL